MRLLIVGNYTREITEAISIAKSQNAKVSLVENITQAINFILEGKGADLILVDAKFDIESLADSLKSAKVSTNIFAYGVHSDAKEAVNSIKAGAKEFLPLPPDERVIASILTSISEQNTNIVGSERGLKKAVIMADKIANSNANVLITGPSGSGKEVFANYIHKKSNREAMPFVSVNCAAIPENLLESELFGHEKGAFTGALSRRVGKFEESSGGTLLLDEISEMDVRLQAKLLRAIQEKQIDRIGGTTPVPVDLRIIATSNRDLEAEIEHGNFRQDLYFRLNIININLPPLSQRLEDIEELAIFFVDKYSKNNNLERKILTKQALIKLQNYNWPGNVRELENIIHRAVLLAADEKIMPDDIEISQNTEKQSEQIPADKILNEKQMLFSTLSYCVGDINKTANILGISTSVLQEKLKNYTTIKM